MKYPQLVSMPTAISEWLEEQLEARGIDAVVYTRYVLSILYRDPVDLFYSEQEPLFFQPDKEVRRSAGGGRKRLRRPARYWNITDADQLKKSAAVQCLSSASDQECGFESLVDELCEKLKDVNKIAASAATVPTNDAVDKPKPPQPKRPKSPQDPTKRYFAAFPPLSRNQTNGKSPYFLIPKWLGSPQKKKRNNNNKTRTKSEQSLHRMIEPENKKPRNMSNLNMAILKQNDAEVPFSIDWLLSSPKQGDPLRGISLSPTEWTDATILTEVATVFGVNKPEEPTIPFGLELNSNNPWSRNFNAPEDSNWPVKWSLGGPANSQTLQMINHSFSSSFSTEICREPKNFQPRRLFSDENPEEDLFTSETSHFKPIKEDNDLYEDGATFPIDSRMDNIVFRRSSSGFFYIEGDESAKKYLEFKREDVEGFTPKYLVKPEEESRFFCASPMSSVSSGYDAELDFSDNGTVITDNDEDDDEDEVGEDEDLLGEKRKCDCLVNGDVRKKWDAARSPRSPEDLLGEKQIWGSLWGEPLCQCFQLEKENRGSGASSSSMKKMLKEEAGDVDDLFSQIDLVMQRFNDELPHMEESVDISCLLSGMQTAFNKRRHSAISTDIIAPRERSYFSFATHLEEECVMKMAPMPTLRSITH